MTDWSYLLADDYQSPIFDELHARIENYQIYSLVWCDHEVESFVTDYAYGVQLPNIEVLSGLDFSQQTTVNIASLGLNVSGSFSDGFYEISGHKVFGKTILAGAYPYPVFDFFQIDDRDDPDGMLAVSAISNGYAVIFTEPLTRVGATAYPREQTISRTISTSLYSFFPDVRNKPSTIISSIDGKQILENTLAIAYQSYDPGGLIPLDFGQIAINYPVVASKQTRYLSRSIGSTVSLSIPLPPLQTGLPNYIDLVRGFRLDPRSNNFDQNILAVANSSRTIEYGCYCRNQYESHLRLLDSLDWRAGKINVVAGQQYTLPLKNCVLGTLITDRNTRDELMIAVSPTGIYPYKYLFKDNLADLFTEWNFLFTDLLDNQQVYPFASTYISMSADESSNQTILTFSKKIYEYKPIVRIMAANNDRWGHTSPVVAQNRPLINHTIFNFDHQDLFESPQPDDSYGTYMTDSPRLLEIWRALGAGDYATYINDIGQQMPRITNIGWMVMKLGEIMGIRRKPNGKYLSDADQTKLNRTRLNNPTWPAGDYDTKSWGNEGYALRHLPTAYVEGQRQDHQYDLVTSFPQMFEALIDQIDLGQGLQHTSEIRIKVGDQVQSYSNLGQLTIDLATRVIELEALMQKSVVMQVETSNTVRELWPAIGLAVTTKSVIVQIGGKMQQIFYPGFQGGKSSIRDIISAGHVNLGILMGQIMPQKVRDSRFNPFNKKGKK